MEMTIERRITLPDEVSATLDGAVLTIAGPQGSLSRNLRYPQVTVSVDGDDVVVETPSRRRKIMAMVGTQEAHIRNMVRGVTEGFEYRMKVVYSHFPIQLKLGERELEIKNFLGEKQPRIAKVVEGVTITIDNDELTLTGIDKEKVGNTAANIEHATKVTKRDARVFQDGIYIVEKA